MDRQHAPLALMDRPEPPALMDRPAPPALMDRPEAPVMDRPEPPAFNEPIPGAPKDVQTLRAHILGAMSSGGVMKKPAAPEAVQGTPEAKKTV
eukprot:6461044-Karenia_brevis.AAC.1